MLNKAIIICFILIVLIVIFQSVSSKNGQNGQTYAAAWTFSNNSSIGNTSISGANSDAGQVNVNDSNIDNSSSLEGVNSFNSYATSNSNKGVQVSTWDQSDNYSYPSNLNLNSAIPSTLPKLKQTTVGLVWQRDPSQYTGKEEFNLWSPSACSAASTASILAAFGHNVKVSDVLSIMEARGGISPQSGLSDYGDFAFVAKKFGLQATLDENHDMESHFNSILAQLKANRPVIVNVQDAIYFPSGHFVVAYHLNDNGTIAIMNPDPSPGKSVIQDWPLEGFKLYFSHTMRSVLFTK